MSWHWSQKIEELRDEEKRKAQNHVSSQWIYGNHMSAGNAYEKVLSIVRMLEIKCEVLEDMVLAQPTLPFAKPALPDATGTPYSDPEAAE